MTRAIPATNRAASSERTRSFVLDPGELIDVRRSLRGTDETILGFYHSHPDEVALPSATDLEYMRLWPRTLWLIVAVQVGMPRDLRAWWFDASDSPVPLEVALHSPPLDASVIPNES